LLSFNTTDILPHDVMVSENDALEACSGVDVFGWVTLSSDCKFELQVEWVRANRWAVCVSWKSVYSTVY